jgi:hypothetical protein
MAAAPKVCIECGEERPNTALHFPTFRKKTELCLACVTTARRRAQEKKKERRDRRMSQMESQSVDALLRASSRGGGNVPHSAELLEQVMTFFGGVNGFAGLLLKNYFDCKPGSSGRTKMLEMVTRLVTTNADQGGSLKPLTMWSEDEIQAELDARLKQAVEQMLPAQAMPIHLLEVEGGEEEVAAEADPTGSV